MNQNNKNLDFSKDFESTNLSTNSPVQNFSLKKQKISGAYLRKEIHTAVIICCSVCLASHSEPLLFG